ncbi:MAG: TDT family transporter [Clostridium argentinense]|uniref:TDT family transporter n=1 Tax=uncultured Clostridium sp. TaxID=59620 RepID=UPI001DE54C8C|nr:TDT family transporter [uncultured Clostridium sp.]MBS5823079.1 TDT family transporter [Clostridium argentinense]MDU1350662.1 TDT family transporter [Clostridium argentinense]
MAQFIKKIPLPLAGVMLSLAALGNLLASYGPVYKNLLGVLSAVILLLITLKILFYSKAVIEDLNNPVIASVIPTYSMGIMLLSVYVKDISFNIGRTMWIIGIVIHILLILLYTVKFVLNFNIRKLFPSTFVVYVGIGTAGITAPAFELANVGQVFFWFSFISFIILLPILIYRTVSIKEIPEPALPTIAIFAAPASLCLVAYLNSFSEKNMFLVGILAVLSFILYLIVLVNLPKLLKLKFYPSFAAFTFPMVISGIALKSTNGFLIKAEKGIGFLKYVIKCQEIIAVLIVFYVLIKYLQFLTQNKPVQSNKTIAK